MTDKNNIPNQDDLMRQMMQTTKQKAPKNLKYRIMQQIETENALTRKKVPVKKEQGRILRELIGIFGVMYAVLMAVVGGAYFLKGKDFVLSPEFLWMVVLIAFVFSVFWLISRLDAYLGTKITSSLSVKKKR